MTDSPTHYILQLVKFLPFHITEACNQRARYPFRAPRDEHSMKNQIYVSVMTT